MKTFFVIEWQANTFETRYHAEFFPNGTTVLENATKYETKQQAENIIEENVWGNCFVSEYEF